MKIVNKTYNLKGNIETNITLISDIHYYEKSEIKHLNKILDNIKKLNTDFICISGDIIDESSILDEDLFIEWLTKLSNITKVIVSIGNHEFYINKGNKEYGLNKNFFDKVKRIKNLYLLDNKNIIMNNINFIGITVPMENYIDEGSRISINEFLKNKNINKKYYNVLLCHTPINICYEKLLRESGIDLILCGHMHGGITPRILRPIFKNNGLISPKKKLFPKNVYGHLNVGGVDIIITSGIMVVSHMNKFKILKGCFPSEVVTLNVNKG